MDDEVSPKNEASDRPEQALDLDFVPTWARKPPENPYVNREDRGESGRPDRRGGGGRREGFDRRGPRPGGGMGRNRPAGDRRGPGRREGERRREGGGPRPEGERRPERERLPRLEVKVSFLPDRERLALVVRDIQASRRAFPLAEIASRFLRRDDLYLVKLELAPAPEGGERQTLLQCLECRRVFRHRARAEAHLLAAHLDKFFTIEEIETEAPAGVFTCVARCRLSGTLLGPPNHHGYNEKIQELWSTRYAHLSKAEYLGQIETVRDEALVEQWKETVRKKTVYRLKEPPPGQEAEAMTRVEAQGWMRSKVNGLLRESARCMVPGPQSREFDDGALRAAVSSAWQKESRFPLTLLLALRPAFRHMRLHLFKVNAKETYVTAVAPSPVDLKTAPERVREIVSFLEANPGISRQAVFDGLRGGADPESAEAAEVLLHLGNLVATGGVIEFFNGTLALPRVGNGPAARAAEAAEPGEAEEDAAPVSTEPAAETTEGDAPEAASVAEAVPAVEEFQAAEAVPAVEESVSDGPAEKPVSAPAVAEAALVEEPAAGEDPSSEPEKAE